MIAQRIERFISDPQSGCFEDLAREAFRFQYDRLETYRRLCQQRGVTPDNLGDWSEIPPIPALAFKSVDLSGVEGGEIFRSSGTTTERPSIHRHGFLDLYRATIDQSFPAAVFGAPGRRPILSLIPDRQQAPESSLSFMIDHVIRRWGTADSISAFSARGVDARRARSFLGARQRDRQAALIVATAFALAQLLDALDRLDLRFRLPPGSVVFETGGYKGRARELSPAELGQRLEDRLSLPAHRIVREYGMTELTSQLYTASLGGGDPFLYQHPHWVRVRVLDPETLEEIPGGRPGLLCILDLANLSSAVHLLTEDLGAVEPGGLRLLGRAAGAELRGCSLTVEELGRS